MTKVEQFNEWRAGRPIKAVVVGYYPAEGRASIYISVADGMWTGDTQTGYITTSEIEALRAFCFAMVTA